MPTYALPATVASARIENAPPTFTDPERTPSPATCSTTMASPVSTDSPIDAAPRTVPSTATTPDGDTPHDVGHQVRAHRHRDTADEQHHRHERQ